MREEGFPVAGFRMLVQMSGTRNGVDWPPVGGVVDLPEVEGAKYARAGWVVPVPVEAAVMPAPERAVVSSTPRKRAPRKVT